MISGSCLALPWALRCVLVGVWCNSLVCCPECFDWLERIGVVPFSISLCWGTIFLGRLLFLFKGVCAKAASSSNCWDGPEMSPLASSSSSVEAVLVVAVCRFFPLGDVG